MSRQRAAARLAVSTATITAATITPMQARLLAKVRVTQRMRTCSKGALPITGALSDLATGSYSRLVYDQLRVAKLVTWDNGSSLTAAGEALLDELLRYREALS